MTREAELAELFARLGARNPSDWARSQLEEGIPQLARFLFLKQAWKRIVPAQDSSWIEAELSANPEDPGGGIVTALQRVLANGAPRSDLTEIVRVMQWKLLFDLCYLLDDPGDLGEGIEDLSWNLFQVNDRREPIAVMSGLHESVLETEPTGSELRSSD